MMTDKEQQKVNLEENTLMRMGVSPGSYWRPAGERTADDILANLGNDSVVLIKELIWDETRKDFNVIVELAAGSFYGPQRFSYARDDFQKNFTKVVKREVWVDFEAPAATVADTFRRMWAKGINPNDIITQVNPGTTIINTSCWPTNMKIKTTFGIQGDTSAIESQIYPNRTSSASAVDPLAAAEVHKKGK